MDYQALKTFIETNYPSDAAEGNDGIILAQLNAASGTTTQSVERSIFAMWAGVTGLRAAIQDHADNVASPLRSIALTLLDFLQGGISDNLNLSMQANIDMLNSWVAATAITTQQRDDLLTLAQKPITIAEVQGFKGVTINDIATALRGE